VKVAVEVIDEVGDMLDCIPLHVFKLEKAQYCCYSF